MALPQIDSLDLAEFALAKLGKMPHLKLQKIVYYADAWHLGVFGCPLVKDDFEAWLHGPVSRRVWNCYKEEATLYGLLSAKREKEGVKAFIRLSEEQQELLTDVFEEYGDKTAYYLECLTHSEEPWVEARKGEASTNVISKDTMKRYYEALLSA
jgi:uncharacterized phage-associated protein